MNSSTSKKSGVFFTFEGGEGSGKSVQSRLLHDALQQRFPHLPVVLTREPGGSDGAESIRHLLTTGSQDRWMPFSEFLLFYAARYDHWCRTIAPTLRDGGIVLCDRFFDSSRIYQGEGLGIPKTFFDSIHQMMLEMIPEDSFRPHRTYVLEIDPHIGLDRSKQRQRSRPEKEDRFEQHQIDFHKRVLQGYRRLVSEDPERCLQLSGTNSIDEIHQQILNDALQVIQKVLA